MSDPAAILVVAPNWLGDAVMALPAIADVAHHFAGARVTVAARPSVAPLFSMVPAVDAVVAVEWRGAAFDRRARNEDAARLRTAAAAVAILLPNSFASAWMARQSGIPERWGYASDMRRPVLTRAVQRPMRSMHQAAYYQHLVRELGVSAGPSAPRLELPAEALAEARDLLASQGWDGGGPLLVLAPGAAYGTAKRWLPAHFARLATMTVAEGTRCVLVGSAADAETAAWVKQTMDARALGGLIDLTGATSLQTLAAVMRLASACVSNDSGAMHLAGAVGVPLAAVFGPTREYETSPLTRPEGRAEVLINPVWCRPCMLRECPIDHRCMKGLAPERVFGAVRRLMENGSR